jgi:hypothetical protein
VKWYEITLLLTLGTLKYLPLLSQGVRHLGINKNKVQGNVR